MVTLANGTVANYTVMTWKWEGTFALVTTAVTVHKGDKIFQLNVTAPPGQPPFDIMKQWVMALVVEP